MLKVKLWGTMVAAVLLAALVLTGQGPAREAQAAENRGGAQLLIDGRQVASFTEVTGLDIQVEALEAVCTSDGRDDDCDGIATEAWQAQVLTALWQLDAVAAELERGAWASSRSKHDTAKNAIGNVRAIIVQTEGAVQDATQSLKTRHDTVKNAIGNIRAAVRALSDITVNEEGVDRAPVKAMQETAAKLTVLADNYHVRKRPGRVKYGNITLRGAAGSTDPAVLEWLQGGAQRKSVSIIFMDTTGKETARYNLFECWPVSFSATEAIEKIEIAVEKVERAR